MKHEIKKLSKMIDEAVTYLMRTYEWFDIDISIRHSGDGFTLRFVLNNVDVSQEQLETLRGRFVSKRRPEVEDYYWQLTGQGDDSNQLRLVAMMCDEVTVTYENHALVLVLRRVIG